jgi:hypothetical protein
LRARRGRKRRQTLQQRTSAPAGPETIPFSAQHWTAFKNAGIKDYDGKIGDDIEIEIVLQGSQNPVSDDAISLDGYGIYKKFNKSFPVRGHADITKKSFEIYEYASHTLDDTGTYKGSLTSNNKLEGTWSSAKKGMRFSLVENPTSNKQQLASRIAEAKNEFERIKSGAGVVKEQDINLDDQAVNEIRKMYDSIYTKCGDSYCRIEDGMPPFFTQFKEVTFQAAPRGLNEADRLNKVEWAGTVNVAARFVRESFAQGGRQHWREYGVPANVAHFNARKVKGNWQLDDMFSSLRRMYRRPTCAEIPKD